MKGKKRLLTILLALVLLVGYGFVGATYAQRWQEAGSLTSQIAQSRTKLAALLREHESPDRLTQEMDAAQAQLAALKGRFAPRLSSADIVDDVLGVAGEREKFGKPIGSDVREGKRTLIVVRALTNAPPEDRATLLRALGKRDASEAELKAAIDVLKHAGAIDYVAKRARELVAQAKSKLKALPESRAREVLSELADFTIKREF